MTRQQLRFEKRNGGPRTVGFTPSQLRRSRLPLPSSQQFELSAGGYRVLHPTKGWRQVSAKRPGAADVIKALNS